MSINREIDREFADYHRRRIDELLVPLGFDEDNDNAGLTPAQSAQIRGIEPAEPVVTPQQQPEGEK